MNANSEVLLTHDGADRLKEELVTLKTHKRKEIADRIKQARGYGDLKENSEYDEAKNEQAFVEGRIATLEKMLKKAIIVEDEEIDTSSVGVGSVVKVLDVDFDEEVEYTIVGSAESDVFHNKISNESPVGSSLMGKKVNEIVEVNAPGGMLEFKILAIHK